MNSSKLIALLASLLAIGSLIVSVQQRQTVTKFHAENAELRDQAEKLKIETEQLKKSKVDYAELERLRGLQSEVNKLRAQVSSGRQVEYEAMKLKSHLSRQTDDSAPGAAAGSLFGTNGMSDAMLKMAKGMSSQQSRGRLLRLKEKLNLSAEQAQAVEGILSKQSEVNSAITQKLLSGQLTKQEMVSMSKERVNPDKEIMALLTPDQQAGYQEFKREETAANTRLAAHAELLQLQNTVGLTIEQQDQVFGVLYEQIQKNASSNASARESSAPGDVNSQIERTFEGKTKALEKILTPTQMELYRQVQQTQIKMIKGFVPQLTAPDPAVGAEGIPVPK
jgi:hypothetical protein